MVRTPNIASYDFAIAEQWAARVAAVVEKRTGSVLSRRVPHLSDEDRASLVRSLVEELTYLLPTRGAALSLRSNGRGPKPRLAEIHFMNRTAALLADAGIATQDWSNGRDSRTELREWCRQLVHAVGLQGFLFSDRQRRVAQSLKKKRYPQGVSSKFERPGNVR